MSIWTLLLAFHRSKATASCRRLSSIGGGGGGGGGIPRCSRLCPWGNGRNAYVRLRSLSTHSSICFYFAVAFLHSGQPGFQLLLVRSSFFVWIIFRLVRHDRFIFFHLCLLSLSVLSSKAITVMKVQRLPPSARRHAQQD